ncbi:MAG: MCP four helix bundle domain-containing protein [Deltaproteobacteria bacterium]|nr:MCP four helix bundle domain-containing protein [Deltaproteobacteria bacterium]
MKLGNARIGIRMAGCFGLIILATIAFGFFTISEMKKLSDQTDKLYKHPFTVTNAALRIDANLLRMDNRLGDAPVSQTKEELDTIARELNQYEKLVVKDLGLIGERFLGDKAKVKEFNEIFTEWRPVRDEVMARMRAGDKNRAAAAIADKSNGIKKRLDKVLGEFITFAQNKAAAFVANAKAEETKALLFTMVLLAGVLMAGVVLVFFMTRSITRPLKQAVDVALRMAEGDLTMKMTSQRQDETGRLLNAMDKMVASLNDMFARNIEASHSLAEGASQQAAAIEETSSSLEEMTSMTKQNADNAAEANRLVKEVNQVIAVANDSMARLSLSMEETSRASEETSKIIKTIDEIAFQTNLLALNAAVEAARAGEVGAGFAVVANEVRSLAMRAAEAARNTSALIENTRKKVTTGTELVTKTKEDFCNVATTSQKVGELIGEIAAASTEQAQGIGQINKAIVEVDTVTQRNASSAEELAAVLAQFRIRGGNCGQSNGRNVESVPPEATPLKKITPRPQPTRAKLLLHLRDEAFNDF